MRTSSGPAPLQRKSSQDFVGGCVIAAMAAFALWLGWDLPFGSLDGIGPGLVPRSMAVLLGLLGLALIISSILLPGDVMGDFAWRGLAFVLAAIVVFAISVRPFGLAISAPLTIFVGALASSETRWGETVVFTAATTAFCIGLFKYALNLPIPLAPWLLGY